MLRFDVDQSDAVLPEEAARVRNTLRLPQTYLRLDVTEEDNQVGTIPEETAALIRQALGIPDEMRHYHVRQIVVQRDNHFLNMKTFRTSRPTILQNTQEFSFPRRRTLATE